MEIDVKDLLAMIKNNLKNGKFTSENKIIHRYVANVYDSLGHLKLAVSELEIELSNLLNISLDVLQNNGDLSLEDYQVIVGLKARGSGVTIAYTGIKKLANRK